MKWATRLSFGVSITGLSLAAADSACYLAAPTIESNQMRRRQTALLLGLCWAMIASPSSADVLAGVLKCRVAGGPSLILGNKRDVKCLYRPNGRGIRQYYVGTINRIGLALGFRSAGTLLWDVRSSLHDVRSLEGEYSGVGGDAKFFDGPNGDMLIGEGERITLTPVTVGGPGGFEVSAGIGRLDLTQTNRSDLFEGLDDDDID